MKRHRKIANKLGHTISYKSAYAHREDSDQPAHPQTNWNASSLSQSEKKCTTLVSILHKSIGGRYRPVRVADGPMTARYRFIKNASLDHTGTRTRHPLIAIPDAHVDLRWAHMQSSRKRCAPNQIFFSSPSKTFKGFSLFQFIFFFVRQWFHSCICGFVLLLHFPHFFVF